MNGNGTLPPQDPIEPWEYAIATITALGVLIIGLWFCCRRVTCEVFRRATSSREVPLDQSHYQSFHELSSRSYTPLANIRTNDSQSLPSAPNPELNKARVALQLLGNKL